MKPNKCDKCSEDKTRWELNKVEIGLKTLYICNDCVEKEKADENSEAIIIDER